MIDSKIATDIISGIAMIIGGVICAFSPYILVYLVKRWFNGPPRDED